MERIDKEVSVSGKKIFLTMPTIRQIQNADVIYSKAYVQAIRDGLKPRAILEREYKEAGVISNEDEAAFLELSNQLQEIIILMRTPGGKEDKNSLYARYLDLKSQYEVYVLQKNMLFQHTAEAKAETAKLTSLAWQCVLDENKKNIWNSQEDILNAKDANFLEDVLKEFVLFFTSLDMAEAKLQEVMDKFLKEEVQLEEKKEEVQQ